ncbi:MAG: sigma factor-like helix-turn-helix DNA-binding protein [Patescibacteria group bacterium]|nr:MAG: sigma factor-like helix-turn-helix DNA-binding protein [Patescibacteria group bacterium]
MNPPEKDSQRDATVGVLYAQGHTFQEIGDKLGLSRERIRQLLNRLWHDEVNAMVERGFAIDLKAFVEAKKKTHEDARTRVKGARLLEKEDEMFRAIDSFTHHGRFLLQYDVTEEELEKYVPAVFEKYQKLKREVKSRWARNYLRCRLCGKTKYKHLREGYCTNCWYDAIAFGGNREKALERARQSCEDCGISRDEYNKKSGNDLNVVKKVGDGSDLENLIVLCSSCMFKRNMSKSNSLGDRWSRKYEKCRGCGTTTDEHFQHGYCLRCFYDYRDFGGNREKAMMAAGEKCEKCGLKRTEHKKRFGKDLNVIHLRSTKDHSLKNLGVYCNKCMGGARRRQKPSW